jgi:hypothetical protein
MVFWLRCRMYLFGTIAMEVHIFRLLRRASGICNWNWVLSLRIALPRPPVADKSPSPETGSR